MLLIVVVLVGVQGHAGMCNLQPC